MLNFTALCYAWMCTCVRLQAADLDLIIDKHLVNNHAISLDLRNESGGDLKLWLPGCSWGDHLIEISIVRQYGTTYVIQEGNLCYTMNGPIFQHVGRNASWHQVIDLHDGQWLIAKIISTNLAKLPKPASLDRTQLEPPTQHDLMAAFMIKSGDTINMTYKVDPTPESIQYGVWTGRVMGTVRVE